MTSMGTHLYILLPVHNRREITVRFVEALAQQTWREFSLILIDDGSRDGTADAVRKILAEVVVLTGTGDWWWAGCLDQGCRQLATLGVVDEDILLLINDDLSLAFDFLARAMAEFSTTTDTLLLARQVDATTGKEIDHGGGVQVDVSHMRFAAANRAEEINCLPTRGLFIRWRDLCRAGGFRPAQLPHYMSDYEFTYRAWRKGLRLRVASSVSVGVQLAQSGESLATVFRLPRSRRFALIFSQRFKNNPVTWSMFIQLTAPPARRPYLWAKIWVHFLFVAVRCLVVSPPRIDR